MGIIARQTIKGTIATYIGVAIGFVTTFFILTKYLTAEEVGLTRVLVDAATLFSSLALLGTSSSTLRFYPHFKDDSRNQQGLYFWTLVIPFVGFLLFLQRLLLDEFGRDEAWVGEFLGLLLLLVISLLAEAIDKFGPIFLEGRLGLLI